MLQLAGETDSTTKAMLIYNIELAIAKFSWDDVEFRDPVKIYNVWDLDLLEAATTGRFSWAGYFNKLRVPTSVLNHTIVAQPDYMTNLTSIFGPATADLAEGLRLYMKYRLLHSKSAVLSQEFRDLSFGFVGQFLGFFWSSLELFLTQCALPDTES
jgi:predicted metalloendopeptidase